MLVRRSAVVLFLMAVLAAVAFAQNNTADEPPKYDVAKEVTIKGTVEEVKQVPNPKGAMGIHLMVKSGSDVLEVRLCPNSFLKEIDIAFNKGDELKVTGSKVRVGEKDVILAREIERGNNTIVLRDKQGVPVWTWLKQGGSH